MFFEYVPSITQLSLLSRNSLRMRLQSSLGRDTQPGSQKIAASTLMVFRKVRDAVIQECESVTIKETSREGDGRIKNNPMFFLYKEMADLLQRNLRALNMNKELTKGRDDKVNDDEADPLALLMKEQKEDD